MGVPVPKGWVEQVEMVAGDGPGNDRGLLQVIISYGYMYSNHTGLRLTCPGRVQLFWDPGGIYKEDDPSYGRRDDLILGKPPTIEQWWAYRTQSCHEPIMAVYEWDLSSQSAEALYGVLINGTDADHPAGYFHSDVASWYCCVAVSDFLMRFAKHELAVPRTWMLPLNLGKHLWTQSPDRVRIFRIEKQPKTYVWPGR